MNTFLNEILLVYAIEFDVHVGISTHITYRCNMSKNKQFVALVIA